MKENAFVLSDPPPKDVYREFTKKKFWAAMLLLLLLLGISLYSLRVGSLHLSISRLFSALLSQNVTGLDHHVLWNIRLPRTIGAVIAGAGLGLAGVVMQNILRNPLASPFTIGVSQGAAFGAAFAIIVLGAGKVHTVGNEAVTANLPSVVVLAAFTGSLITVGLILLISTIRDISSEGVILAGVALSAFFGAATMFLQYFATDMQVAATVFWTFGDLGKAGWRENLVLALVLCPILLLFMRKGWDYNAFQWGDDAARGLGLSVRRLRLISLLLSALMVSIITAFLGIIGFIGLMAPHLMKRLVGSDYRFLVPLSATTGALILLISDIIARTVMGPIILPVGIITSFAGAPLFLYLLVKGRKS